MGQCYCADHASDMVFVVDSSDTVTDSVWASLTHSVSETFLRYEEDTTIGFGLVNFALYPQTIVTFGIFSNVT